jgi:hypothetical protein
MLERLRSWSNVPVIGAVRRSQRERKGTDRRRRLCCEAVRHRRAVGPQRRRPCGVISRAPP